jgi:hypothetical protein
MIDAAHRPMREAWLPRLTKIWVGRVTRFLLIGAFLVGVTGIVRVGVSDYHLDVETLAVLAALTGVYAERRAAAVERRRTAIKAVQKELDDNIVLLGSDARFKPQDKAKPEPHLYPRVSITATEACLAQDALIEEDDAECAATLSSWRERAETFNRGVNLMELLFFGIHLIAPRETDIMLRVDDELQKRITEMIAETRNVRELLNSASQRAQAADDGGRGTAQIASSAPAGAAVSASLEASEP